MHIVIVGPGIMPIPPKGWGAVESLIWDYKLFLERIPNVRVSIVNNPNKRDIIHGVNSLRPDIVHIQYDNHYDIWNQFECKRVIVTSHYGYIDSLHERKGDGYWGILHGFVQCGAKIHALSPSIKNVYLQNGASEDRVKVISNGANHELFRYAEQPLYPDRSIYLAKIDYRKRQSLYQNISFIDFVGNLADRSFIPSRRNYLGEWTKDVLYDNLTNYSNLVLLSDGEAHPLVCCEALVAGLGLVISEFAAANLDTTLPWIDVIPTERLNDIPYIEQVIRNNQVKSVQYRKQIREYALAHFTWESIVKKYLEAIHDWFQLTP